ncbi:MAG TPA: hypothetical protein VG204_11265 [Terriglobia bacterium]|nr:hypothetical protein [Terriglobia bacterium]
MMIARLRKFSQSLTLLVSGLALFLLCFFTFRQAAIRHLAHAQVLVSPFQLEIDYIAFDQGHPEGQLQSHRIDAQRSDGATALKETIMFPSGPRTTRKLILMDGRVITIDDLISAKSTMRPYSEAAIAARKQRISQPPTNCVRPDETLVTHTSILGQEVVVIKKPFQEDETTGETVYWRAPGLGCERLKYEVWTKQADGSLKLAMQARPLSLKLSEPDQLLFDEGTTYAELPPSGRVHRKFQALGIPDNDEGLQKWYEKADQLYREKQ